MGYVDYTWFSTITGNVIVEVWGGGGGGGVQQRGGGGGSAYARTAGLAVILGNPYLVRVADPGAPNNNGDTSLYSNLSNPAAVGGNGAVFGVPGTGGLASACTGDVKFSGGDGDAQTITSGGGGGGSAGDASDGNNAAAASGAPPVSRGGKGGNGSASGNGENGGGPGGGGGGGGPVSQGGFGGRGAVVIWQDMGVWPPVGQTPLATFGSPPTTPKTAKSATFM